MGTELSYQEAQRLAIKLANEDFSKKEFRHPHGGELLHKVTVDYLAGKKEGSRWLFGMDSPSGPSVNISFEADGSQPQVKTGYSWY